MSTTRRLLLAALLCLGTASCGGDGCADLSDQRAAVDRARADYLQLAGSGTASGAQTEQADTALHRLEAALFDAEQRCGDG